MDSELKSNRPVVQGIRSRSWSCSTTERPAKCFTLRTISLGRFQRSVCFVWIPQPPQSRKSHLLLPHSPKAHLFLASYLATAPPSFRRRAPRRPSPPLSQRSLGRRFMCSKPNTSIYLPQVCQEPDCNRGSGTNAPVPRLEDS